MLIKLSTYWKCQLSGWLFYSLIFCGIDAYKQNLPLNKTFPYVILGGILIVLIGVLLSHQMRKLIRRFHILQKNGHKQFVYLLFFTVLFTLFFWLLFNFIINRLSLITPISGLLRGEAKYVKWFLSQNLLFSVSFLVWNLVYFIFHNIQLIKKGEKHRLQQETKLIELEATALRAQMNPHFIFNCMNSIKSLIQQHENEKSVIYLTTFSKLIRTLFSNADKKEISLYDEIETCKLYLQLEAMRFDTKFSYSVKVDDNMDLKSVQIPALIIQPFIENAIWHGIVPKEEGGHVELSVMQKENSVEIVIDDNGIGREASKQNKSVSGLTHQSKGVNLAQSRLELDNLLRQRKAKLEIIDKKNQKGGSIGTRIILNFKELE